MLYFTLKKLSIAAFLFAAFAERRCVNVPNSTSLATKSSETEAFSMLLVKVTSNVSRLLTGIYFEILQKQKYTVTKFSETSQHVTSPSQNFIEWVF